MVLISVPFTVKASCLPFNALSLLAVPKIIHSVLPFLRVRVRKKKQKTKIRVFYITLSVFGLLSRAMKFIFYLSRNVSKQEPYGSWSK